MEKGKGTGKHRDTGRQRSDPEEGKHARQPEGPTGGANGPLAGLGCGGYPTVELEPSVCL